MPATITYNAEGTGGDYADVHPVVVQWIWRRLLRRPSGEEAWLLLQTQNPRLAARIVAWGTKPPHILLADVSEEPLATSLVQIGNASADPSPFDGSLVEEMERAVERFEPLWLPAEMEEFKARMDLDREMESARRERERKAQEESDRRARAVEERARAREWRAAHPEEAQAQDLARRRESKQRRRDRGKGSQRPEEAAESGEEEREAEPGEETQLLEEDTQPPPPRPTGYRGGGKSGKSPAERDPLRYESDEEAEEEEEEEESDGEPEPVIVELGRPGGGGEVREEPPAKRAKGPERAPGGGSVPEREKRKHPAAGHRDPTAPEMDVDVEEPVPPPQPSEVLGREAPPKPRAKQCPPRTVGLPHPYAGKTVPPEILAQKGGKGGRGRGPPLVERTTTPPRGSSAPPPKPGARRIFSLFGEASRPPSPEAGGAPDPAVSQKPLAKPKAPTTYVHVPSRPPPAATAPPAPEESGGPSASSTDPIPEGPPEQQSAAAQAAAAGALARMLEDVGRPPQ